MNWCIQNVVVVNLLYVHQQLSLEVFYTIFLISRKVGIEKKLVSMCSMNNFWHSSVHWFIDDIFLIWKGDKDSLIDFLDCLNNVVPSIKFTHEISTDSVNFLDTTVLKDGQGYINTDVYQKPTDTHPYLHWTSAHPPHLKRSIPYQS